MPSAASEVMRLIHGVDVYDGVRPTLPADLQGWNSEHPVFRRMFELVRPRIVLDVGVWKGRSSLHLAALMREFGIDGAVISIDSFLGSPEHWLIDAPDFRQSLAFAHGLPRLYDQFVSNVLREGGTDLIVPLAQTSANAATILDHLGIRAGLVHVDAGHDHDSVLGDARRFWALLRPGGVLVGDDYVDSWPGVISAARQFAAETGLHLNTSVPKWFVRKPG